jgi:K+-transporting ATPase ATPase B chain
MVTTTGTIIFLLAVATLEPFAAYSGGPVSVPVLAAILVCLIPTTIGGLLSAIGIAGMDRLLKKTCWPYRGGRLRQPGT